MRPLAKNKPSREPTIALINIVFLMLVFFMVAGTLTQPLDDGLKLVETRDLEGQVPPNALVIHPDGRLVYNGADQADTASFFASLPPEARSLVRLVPDRELSAQLLVQLTRELRAAGADKVVLVTQKALE